MKYQAVHVTSHAAVPAAVFLKEPPAPGSSRARISTLELRYNTNIMMLSQVVKMMMWYNDSDKIQDLFWFGL